MAGSEARAAAGDENETYSSDWASAQSCKRWVEPSIEPLSKDDDVRRGKVRSQNALNAFHGVFESVPVQNEGDDAGRDRLLHPELAFS